MIWLGTPLTVRAVVTLFGTAIVLAGLLLWIIPFLLALITVLRKKKKNPNDDSNEFRTALYVGRMWHVRFEPIQHAFTYPYFTFALDMSEVTMEKKIFEQELWPLSLIMSFRESDHLKDVPPQSPQETFLDRLFRLI